MKKGTVINLLEDDENLIRTKNLFGETHTIEAVLGTKVNLPDLLPGQSVVYGDGKHYHFRLTKKEFLKTNKI